MQVTINFLGSKYFDRVGVGLYLKLTLYCIGDSIYLSLVLKFGT